MDSDPLENIRKWSIENNKCWHCRVELVDGIIFPFRKDLKEYMICRNYPNMHTFKKDNEMQNSQEVIKKKHEGYGAAGVVDSVIEGYMEDFPLEDPNNLFFWLTFCRIVESSIGIIEQYYYDSKNNKGG